MHQALNKPDILHEIFGHILWQNPTNTHQELSHRQPPTVSSTLLSCALACQSFQEPALDKLWWRLDSIAFLFRLLPSFELFNNGIYFLDGPIEDADWTVFDGYARRIYGLYDTCKEDIDPSAFIQIAQGRKGIPFLPSLRYLFTTRQESELLVFLLPSIRWLHCQPPLWGNFYPSIWAVVSGLTQVAPGLQSLNLQLPLSEYCFDSLMNFKSLRHLSFRAPIDAEFFAKLSSLEDLTSLHIIGLTDSMLSHSLSISAYFPTLRTLTVSSTIAQIIPLLRIAKFQQLKFFSYTQEVDDTTGTASPYESETENWRNFFRLLCQNTNEFLEGLTISHAVTASHADTVGVHGLSTFPDLLRLRLKSFIISSHLFLSLTNCNIKCIADAWPTLRVLHLAAYYIAMDFDALIEVAKHLPLLDELHIPIYAQSLPSVDSVPLLSHRLRSLDVTKSLVKDSATFARCVDRLFPNLETFQGGGTCLILWNQVKTLIPYLQGARQDAELRLSQDAMSSQISDCE